MAAAKSKKELHQQAQNFITDLVELGGANIVHPSGMISSIIAPEDPIVFTTKDKSKQFKLYVYSTNVQDPDACVLNPFSEGCGKTRLDNQIFYSTMRKTFIANLKRVFELLINCSAGTAANITEIATNPAILRVTQGFSTEIDENTLEEFNLIEFNKFVSIGYNKETLSTSLRSCFDDPEREYIKSFGTKIRKKTWKAFEKILSYIFAVDDIKSKPIYTATVDNPSSPQFLTTVETIVFGWNKLLIYLPFTTTEEFFEQTTKQIMRIEKHMEHVFEYKEVCLWLNSAVSTPRSSGIDKEVISNERPKNIKPFSPNPNPNTIEPSARQKDIQSALSFAQPEPVQPVVSTMVYPTATSQTQPIDNTPSNRPGFVKHIPPSENVNTLNPQIYPNQQINPYSPTMVRTVNCNNQMANTQPLQSTGQPKMFLGTMPQQVNNYNNGFSNQYANTYNGNGYGFAQNQSMFSQQPMYANNNMNMMTPMNNNGNRFQNASMFNQNIQPW